MKVDPLAQDSPLIVALVEGAAFRRMQLVQGLRNRNAADDLCDSAEHLCALMNHCFWASIHLEEGRSVRGALCVCAFDEAPRSRAFAKPLLCSVTNIVTLLTASPGTPLAIQLSATGLEIWGVLDATPMFTLRIRIAGAGTVIASEGRNVIALLERGEAHTPKSAGAIDWILLVANALDKAKSFPERMKIAALLQRVVVAMHRQGHGGALVVVPTSNDTWSNSVSLAFRFDNAASAAIQGLLAELDAAEKRRDELRTGATPEVPQTLLPLFAESVNAHRDLLDTLLRSIGDLSAVDGAVVVAENFSVLGFGAKLQGDAGDFDVLVLDVLNGELSTISHAELGGTRHQSAARFVNQHHEAMVFVASQDGRLTLFVWVIDQARVAAVRRLEHFVWDCDC